MSGPVNVHTAHLCMPRWRDRLRILWNGKATFIVRVLISPDPDDPQDLNVSVRATFLVGHVGDGE